MKNRILLVCIFLLFASSVFAAVTVGMPDKKSPELQAIRDLFIKSADQIDLAKARLTMEKMLDPSVDVQATLNELDRIHGIIKTMPRYNKTTEGKLNALIQYFYHAGDWNNNNPYHYDFDDPLGTEKPENSLISNYLKTRRGNCVSMPITVLILGDRLGLDMSLSTAPLHFFVQLRDQNHIFNVEATAGGLKSKASYIREYLITDQAIRNGVFLKYLSKRETLSAMLAGLASHYAEQGNNEGFDKAFEITKIMLDHYPNNTTAMIIRGNVWRNILHRDLDTLKKKGITKPTPAMDKHFEALIARNNQWYAKAESLGWREPPKDYNERYLKMISEVKTSYEK